MNTMGNSTDRSGTGAGSRETIDALISDLSSKEGIKRVQARRSLVAIGTQAVEPLEDALSNKNKWVRWEAAKALSQIGDPAATQALIGALEDEMFDVRWLAAEGLITIGYSSVAPLLHALIKRPESTWLREGAHHVFHDITDENMKPVVQPVLTAIEDLDAVLEVSIAAEKAINSLAAAT